MRSFFLPFFTLMALMISGCQSPKMTTGRLTQFEVPENSDQMLTDVVSRAARVSEVHYALSVKLNKTDTTFSGVQKIEFELTDATSPLRVDFFEGAISSLILNDRPLDPSAKTKYSIVLPTDHLKKGRNSLYVSYTQEYSRQGKGLHRFQDPETNEVFLYSQFESYDANRFMPCFDQPDLKATLDLEVTAPPEWQVISTTSVTDEKMLAPDTKFTKFATTPRLATYLFSLHAGPYQVWTDKFEGMKLRLFARPSMAKYVPVAKWFQITKQGLKFFNQYYAFPYPFKKYDQLIVPEFNAGAMENVGAVTFSEVYLSRSPIRRDQWRRASGTILHEMAHMWFGDLVTMKWWNDLWLNESFATYMGTLALQEATEFKEAWQEFFAGSKTGAYWMDSLASTHPIEAPVASVKQAFTNFDAITYGKGASVLKQLSHYIGPAQFQKGVQVYLKRHAYGNSELKDFIAALQEQTPKDLNLWADRWLRQSGVDQLQAQWTCDGDSLKKMKLVLSSAPNSLFRPQTISVSLHKLHSKKLVFNQRFDVNLDKPEVELKGNWACPNFVYPNDQDHGYMHVQLDPKSLATLKSNLSDIGDLRLRTQVWNDLWRMVRYENMRLREFVEIVDRYLPQETNELILRELVGRVSGLRSELGTVFYYWPTEPETSKMARQQFVTRIESEYLRRFENSKPGTDLQKFWFDSFLHVARTPARIDQLQTWFEKGKIGPEFPWDLDRQWAVVYKLSRFGGSRAAFNLAKMQKADLSERGRKQALAIDAVRPNIEVKKKWLGQLEVAKPPMSISEAKTVLYSLFPIEQKLLAKQFKNDFYIYMKQEGRGQDISYPQAVVSSLAPLFCSQTETNELKSFLAGEKDFDPAIEKNLAIGIEEDERCQRVRANSEL